MGFVIIVLNFLLFWNISLTFLKEFPPLPWLKTLFYALVFYFITGFLLQPNPFPAFIFFSTPLFLLFSGFLIWEKKKDKVFLWSLYKILPPLIAQMKLGFGFLDAWQRCVKEEKNKTIAGKLKEVSEILRFQKPFSHIRKEIKDFVIHLSQARNSPQCLKRLTQLQEKIKVEQFFHRKASRVLLQLKLQSFILSFLYLSLLIWTLWSSGFNYPKLIGLSLFLFSVGLFWIFKTGQKMKWSL